MDWNTKMVMFRLDAVGRVWGYAWPRMFDVLLVVGFFCVPILALVWNFGFFDELRVRVFMSVMVALALVLWTLGAPRPWRSRFEMLPYSLIILAFLLFALGDKFDIRVLAMNAMVVALVLLLWWLIWLLLGRSWLLLTATGVGVIAVMIYWMTAVGESKAPWDIALLPLPSLILVIAVWAPMARAALYYARIWKYRWLAGPALQALAMVVLFLPTILAAIMVPGALGLDGPWSSVSLSLVGVLLSVIISEPLRRFLLRWADLSIED